MCMFIQLFIEAWKAYNHQSGWCQVAGTKEWRFSKYSSGIIFWMEANQIEWSDL